MLKKVPAKWLANVENPEELQKKLLEQKVLFARLYDMLVIKEASNYKNKIKKSNYEIENWSEQQADSIGYARCLEEIKSLLKFTQE